MSAAVMMLTPFLQEYKRWEYVGAGAAAVSTGSSIITVSFPTTAQAGDLAVFCASVQYFGTPPSGWTLIASGSQMQAYKVCTGGETYTTFTAGSDIGGGTNVGQILLFRPSGGAASLSESNTNTSGASTLVTAGSSSSVIVAIGNSTWSVTWAPTLPGTWSVVQNRGTSPALYVAWCLMEPGEATKMVKIDSNDSSARQTFGIWSII